MERKPDLSFCGLSRSGNHAMIFWYLSNMDNYQEIRANTFVSESSKKFVYCNDVSICPIRTNDQEVSEYELLVFSHEDRKIDGDNVFYLCRDFLNLMSSRIKKWFPNGNNYCQNFDDVMDCWVHNHTANTNNLIIYNEWILSKTYRDKIADALSITNEVDKHDYVPSQGSGSSFIGRKLECSPTNYFDRYKKIDWEPEMVEKILSNETLLKINEEIYGMKIPDLLKKTA